MKRITAMKITKLSLMNFRNHRQTDSYSFGDLNYIAGDNGTGKTTMAHGIAYALYGVSYYGEQNIGRLLNEKSTQTKVCLEFLDQDGIAHSLVRIRDRDKTSILFDSYTIRQKDIEQMFCEKDLFLSMFNPAYLIEQLGVKGRDLILKLLPPVSVQDVLSQIDGSFGEYLRVCPLDTRPPEALLKNYRELIREEDRQITRIDGQIQEASKAQEQAEAKLQELYREKQHLQERYEELSQKQFSGIDLDDLAIQKELLSAKLAEGPDNSHADAAKVRAKMEQIQQQQYTSKFLPAITQLQTELNLTTEEYRKLHKRMKGIKPGMRCPTCMLKITEENISDVVNGMSAELQKIVARGQELTAQKNELDMLDQQSLQTFEKYKKDDLTKLAVQFSAIQAKIQEASNLAETHNQLEQIEETLRMGNLSDDEFAELNSLDADKLSVEAQIHSISELSGNGSDRDALQARQQELRDKIIQGKNFISALTEYICKKAELAVKDLQMPNVKIKLFDVVRTTGEVTGVFKFTYKGRDYATLSLSEKALAGIEVAAMMRRISGIDCPICVDNTESIAAFNPVEMPSQTLLIRFVKGHPLSVKYRGIPDRQVTELKKAG